VEDGLWNGRAGGFSLRLILVIFVVFVFQKERMDATRIGA